MEEQWRHPGTDSFPSSSARDSSRFSARWLWPVGRPFSSRNPSGSMDSRWNISQSPGKVCFQTCLWLSRPVLPTAFPSLYRGMPQARSSPVASPGPVRGSQALAAHHGLRWLLFTLPPGDGIPDLHVGRYCTGAASHPSLWCARRCSGVLILSFY